MLKRMLFLVVVCAACSIPDNRDFRSEDDPVLVADNNEFAFALYSELCNNEGNLFFSPYSISSALAMTYAGARGDTAKEMADAMRFRLEDERLHAAFGRQIKELNGEGKKRAYQLTIANAIWTKKGSDFSADLNATSRRYGADLGQVDFAGDPDEARSTINRWVEKKTQERIKNLVPKLTRGTQLVLTNAVHFKGDWAVKFKKNAAIEDDFQCAGDRTVKVQMMQQTSEFRYHETDDMQALELPYAGKELSMVVLLPKRHVGLKDIEKDLTSEVVAALLPQMRKTSVKVQLPKFKVEESLDLNDVLKSMGMRKAFSDEADFSGINGRKDLKISKVVHKAFVDVNEEGTEAAAATAVLMETKGGRHDPYPIFRADHPFIFLIRHIPSGSILFIGRLSNP